MLNKFCFHLYAQNSVFIGENSQIISLTVTLSLFLTLTLFQSLIHSLSMLKSHSHTHTHSLTLDMLNKFCFHLHAQKSLFIAENCNVFFDIIIIISSSTPVSLEFIELVTS